MKDLILIAVIVAGLATSAVAQLAGTTWATGALLSDTTVLAGPGTNTLADPPVVTLRGDYSLGLQSKVTTTNSMAADVVYVFQKSLDGVNFNAGFRVTNTIAHTAAGSSSPVVIVDKTNYTGFRKLKLVSVENKAASTTNTVINLAYGYFY